MCPRMWSALSGRRRATRRCSWMNTLPPQASVRNTAPAPGASVTGEETSPTLRAGVVPAAIALDYHPADSRIGIGEPEKIQTLTSRMGTGGNNVPLVMDGKAQQGLPAQTLKIRSGCEGGGKGAQVQVEESSTLGCNNDQTVFVPYGICSKASHAMLSENRTPDSTRPIRRGRWTRTGAGRTAPRAGSRLWPFPEPAR